jgi:hypothetical protein
MELLIPIWKTDSKYAKTESIQCCWRKDGLLTASEEADLGNEIGHSTVPALAKVILDAKSNELCALFSALHIRGSIRCEKRCTDQELVDICTTWVAIEEDEEIITEKEEEALQHLMNDSPLPSFNDFNPDDFNDEGPDSMDCDIEQKYTWNEHLASCDVIL